MKGREFMADWISIVAEEEEAGKRIDKFLADFMPNMSRSYLQKLFGTENILLEGKKVKPG